MVVREPPKIDRDRIARQRCARDRVFRVLQRVTDLLAADEYLGEPVRLPDRIEIPVHRGDPAPLATSDLESLQALMAAWFDAPLADRTERAFE